MSYTVPDTESDSTDKEDSFYSQESYTMSGQDNQFMSNDQDHPMIQEQPSRPAMSQEQQNQLPQHNEAINLSAISPALYQALREQLTSEIRSQLSQPLQPASESNLRPSSTPLSSYVAQAPQSNLQFPSQVPTSISQWSLWDGLVSSFDSHILQVQIKIEEEKAFLGSNRSICLGIFRSIPTAKQPRIIHWFETGGADRSHDWEKFIVHVKSQFQNKQARQTAGNLLKRMRMGQNQYFTDFLQDFELKLSQCGGIDWSDCNKIIYLDTGINAKLRQLLLNKSLPDDDYLKWVNKVKAVAGRLENTPSYRPNGCSGKNTYYIPQNGSMPYPVNTHINSSHNAILDADGDTKMSGIKSLQVLQAAINALSGNSARLNDTKPRAIWRSQDEFKKLTEEGKCMRCTKKGHNSRACPKYRAAIRPASISSPKSINDLKKIATELDTMEDTVNNSEMSGEE